MSTDYVSLSIQDCRIAPGLKVAKDIRFALKLIEKARPIDRKTLENPEIPLKTLI
ncbi:hypothetical protein ACUNV4_21540 [Granulosicoccus sp. 3-233]|uniref:hypothetical protein n=1 Tax=Granulosicoccus sp. 3-233 TaxID=3417969 RepID=UPI003D3286A4